MGEVWNEPDIIDPIIAIIDERIERVAAEAVRSYVGEDAFLAVPVLYDGKEPLSVRLFVDYPLDDVEVSAPLQRILRDELQDHPRDDGSHPGKMLRALLRILEEHEGVVDLNRAVPAKPHVGLAGPDGGDRPADQIDVERQVDRTRDEV